MEKLERKYGIWTATAMVVGIVIGSGVFFKADDVLVASGGDLVTALTAWGIGGAIMVITAFVFAGIATRIQKVNGLVDYFEEAYGPQAGYFVAWFMTFIYYPTLVAVLAWVSANYSISLLGLEKGVWLLSSIYLLFFFLLNIFSPVLAGKWQVSTTVIKLVPLTLVAVVGSILGLKNGQTVSSFADAATNVSGSGGLAVATLATAFAYEGWIIATSINAELKNAKKTLPRALFFGSCLVVAIYMLYYLGISGVLSNNEVIEAGNDAPVRVLSLIFGRLGGTILSVFVIISCLGTLNGLVMGSSRGMFAIASRGRGPKPELFSRIESKTNATMHSAIVGFVMSCFWLLVWHGNFAGWWGRFMDISELPIAFLYVVYISLYFWVVRRFEEGGVFSRYIAPLLATAGSCFIIWGAVQKEMFLHFLLLTICIVLTGLPFMNEKNIDRS